MLPLFSWCSRDPLPCPSSSQASLTSSSNDLDSLSTLVPLGYAITIHNGTFTWAQDLPPTLHR